MRLLRCYRCSHDFTADPNLIDTCCPKCGSGSFTRGAEFDQQASRSVEDIDAEWFDMSHDAEDES